MKPHHKGYEIKELKRNQVLKKWESHFQPKILEAFKGIEKEGYWDAHGVEEDCYERVYNNPDQRHLVMFKDGKVVGALFCVDSKKDPKKDYTSSNWLFASPGLDDAKRHEIADALVDTYHRRSRKQGYTRIEAQIGSKDGIRYYKGRGYVKHPTNKFLWVYEL